MSLKWPRFCNADKGIPDLHLLFTWQLKEPSYVFNKYWHSPPKICRLAKGNDFITEGWICSLLVVKCWIYVFRGWFLWRVIFENAPLSCVVFITLYDFFDKSLISMMLIASYSVYAHLYPNWYNDMHRNETRNLTAIQRHKINHSDQQRRNTDSNGIYPQIPVDVLPLVIRIDLNVIYKALICDKTWSFQNITYKWICGHYS